MTDCCVAIAGAGPVGLALGVGLARHGVASVVLEEREALSEHSKAPGILARTLEIFRAWDVLPRILSEGFALSRVNLWLADASAPSATIDLTPIAEFTAVPPAVILPQNRTEAILHDTLIETGGADIRFGQRVSGFTQDAEGVDVRVERRGGDQYSLRASFLVGCDGPHSTVRETLGWSLEGKTYPTRVMLADVRLPDARNDLPWPRFAPLGRVFAAAVKIQPDLWRMLGLVEAGTSDEAATADEAIRRRVERLFGPGPFDYVWGSVFRIHCRTSPHFRDRRVLLAGDAAHINSPAGGQGMNSGIQDAHNLAWKLARIVKGAPIDPLLASYESERRPVIVTNVDWYTDLLTRGFLLPPPSLRAALLRVVRSAVQSRAVMRRLVRRMGMLDAVYRDSPIINGTGAQVGARAHDVALGRAEARDVRLLDLVAHEAALLLFDDGGLPRWDADALSRLVADIPELRVWRIVRHAADRNGPSDLVDATGAAWRHWQPATGLAVLVRPDGYVGWMAARPTAEALVAAIQRALGGAAGARASAV